MNEMLANYRFVQESCRIERADRLRLQERVLILEAEVIRLRELLSDTPKGPSESEATQGGQVRRRQDPHHPLEG